MKNLKISHKLYIGFGVVLLLTLVVAGEGYLGMKTAESTFTTYRTLARQTNADGRIQANMLMTRIFAKNFVIDANRENIAGVQERAEETLKQIKISKELLSDNTARSVLLDDLEESLQRYVDKFKEVTTLQEKRNDLVFNKLNKIGPETERQLSQILEDARKDKDTEGLHKASLTLRSFLLGRLYANRFLIENDEASRARAIQEFRDVEFNARDLKELIDDPERKAFARSALENQQAYLQAFDEVHRVITERNNIIRYELDRIGPAVANRIEKLKLAIKQQQDDLGPKAQQDLNQAVLYALLLSIVVLSVSVFAAVAIGRGITRPVNELTEAAVAMEKGDLKRSISMDRNDELGILSKSLSAMRDAINEKVSVLEQEVAERRKAENELSKTHENLENLVEERTVELQAARDEAERATKAKAEFLAAMSHEIRTPMNGVIGMVDLLQQTKMSRDQKEMVDTVKSSAFSLLTIINDILDFSKIEAGKLNLENIPMSVCDVVEGVTETLAPTAMGKNITIHSYVDPTIPDAVIGDSVRLRQILFNLGGNAVKFTQEGSVALRVERVSRADSKNITFRFEVTDTGIGIPEEAQKTLFEAFTQAEQSTTRRFGGTGLGLTISQRLVRLMDGEIGVDSEPGKGSTFWVTATFPVATDHQIKSDGYDLTGLNVLLAVSTPFLQESLSRYLSHWGCSVTVQSVFERVETQVLEAMDRKKQFDVLFMENIGLKRRTDIIRAVQGSADDLSTHFVLQVDHRIAKREDLENTVYAALNPIKRAPFIRAIAAAAARTSPDVDYNEFDELPETATRAPTVEEAESSGQLILFAEDNITNQKVIQRQLNSLGYTAIIAEDGEVALKEMDRHSFAILLTDCHMPNLDGFSLTRKIREREGEKARAERLPIVAITASALTEEVEQCYDAGMDDVLSKPLEIAKLHVALKKWMPARKGEAVSEQPVEKSDAREIEGIKIPAETDGASDEKAAEPIDLTFLTEVFGDDKDAIFDILRGFVPPSLECRNEVERGLEMEALDRIAGSTHKLKSAARSVGANSLAEICAKMESASKNGDWDPVKELAPMLSQNLDEVVSYIEGLQG